MKCSKLSVDTNVTTVVQVPSYTFEADASHSLQISGSIDCVDGEIVPNLSITGDIDVTVTPTPTTTPQILSIPISAPVTGVSCGMISGLGLTGGAAPAP